VHSSEESCTDITDRVPIERKAIATETDSNWKNATKQDFLGRFCALGAGVTPESCLKFCGNKFAEKPKRLSVHHIQKSAATKKGTTVSYRIKSIAMLSEIWVGDFEQDCELF
jgi:hypothetical protein